MKLLTWSTRLAKTMEVRLLVELKIMESESPSKDLSLVAEPQISTT